MAHTAAVAYHSLLACEWPLEVKLAALLSGDQSFISVAVLITMNLYSFAYSWDLNFIQKLLLVVKNLSRWEFEYEQNILSLCR